MPAEHPRDTAHCCGSHGAGREWQWVPGPAQGAHGGITGTPSLVGKSVWEGQAGSGGSATHAGAQAVGGSPSPLCCSAGHPLAPSPTAPGSPGLLPDVGVGGATCRLS